MSGALLWFGLIGCLGVMLMWVIPHGSRPEGALVRTFNVVTRPIRRVMGSGSL